MYLAHYYYYYFYHYIFHSHKLSLVSLLLLFICLFSLNFMHLNIYMRTRTIEHSGSEIGAEVCSLVDWRTAWGKVGWVYTVHLRLYVLEWCTHLIVHFHCWRWVTAENVLQGAHGSDHPLRSLQFKWIKMLFLDPQKSIETIFDTNAHQEHVAKITPFRKKIIPLPSLAVVVVFVVIVECWDEHWWCYSDLVWFECAHISRAW